MDRHEWREKFRLMDHDEFTMELRIQQDAKDPEFYGMLGEAEARLNSLKHHRDQLKGFYNEISDALGVGGANYGDVLERIKELRHLEQAFDSADQTPKHPGEILLHEYMKPAGMKSFELALEIGVGTVTLDLIIDGKKAINADTALRLGRYFGVSPEMWLFRQSAYDLAVATARKGDYVERRVKPRTPAA